MLRSRSQVGVIRSVDTLIRALEWNVREPCIERQLLKCYGRKSNLNKQVAPNVSSAVTIQKEGSHNKERDFLLPVPLHAFGKGCQSLWLQFFFFFFWNQYLKGGNKIEIHIVSSWLILQYWILEKFIPYILIHILCINSPYQASEVLKWAVLCSVSVL